MVDTVIPAAANDDTNLHQFVKVFIELIRLFMVYVLFFML